MEVKTDIEEKFFLITMTRNFILFKVRFKLRIPKSVFKTAKSSEEPPGEEEYNPAQPGIRIWVPPTGVTGG